MANMVEMDYKTLTLEDMMNYISENHNDAESKAKFKEKAIKVRKEEYLVNDYDEKGNIRTVTDKEGNQKPKKKRVPKPDGKEITIKDVLSAKKYFYETYKNEIKFKNAPKEKKEDTLLAELLNW